MTSKPKTKPTRARTLLRQAARALDKLTNQRTRLAKLEPGGSPANPIGVESSAVVESKAAQNACLKCNEPLSVESHEAVVIASRRLRQVRLRCRRCGLERLMWFRIEGALLN
jgi:hypothetical protein